MKLLVVLSIFLCAYFQTKAQAGEFEVKVVAANHPTVVGQIKKISIEGLGVEDYNNRYFIFRPQQIKKIKVRKRGFGLFDGTKDGALVGAGVAGVILALGGEDGVQDSQVKAAVIAFGTGLLGGTLVGAIAQIGKTKLVLRIDQQIDTFRHEFHKLSPYVDKTVVEHIDFRVN